MIDGSQFLKEIRSKDPHLALLLEQIIDGVNGNAETLGVNPGGQVQAPAPLQAINVKAANGDVHITLTHNSPISKNIRYFVEAATDDAFSQPHVFDLGSSRTLFTRLPPKDDSGNPLAWRFRAYPQYAGSPPSTPTTFGNPLAPTQVAVGGTTQLTPLASTGSGTAKPDGTQGGKGLGIVLFRPAVGPLVPVAPNRQ